MFSTLIIFTVILHTIEGGFPCGKHTESGCNFVGYKPAGGVTEVGDLVPPKINAQEENVMNTLFHRAGQANAVASGLTDVFNIIKIAAAHAPYMGAVVGVFGAITEIVSSETSSSSGAIVEAFSRGIAQLTTDMNNKLDVLVGYIDTENVAQDEAALNEKFQVLWSYWMTCIRSVTVEDANHCQRDTFTTAISHMVVFLKYNLQISSEHELEPKQYREIEAKLPSFRVYADLVLMILKALIDTYKADDTDEGKAHYKRYSEDLDMFAKAIVNYATKAVSAVKKYQIGGGWVRNNLPGRLGIDKSGWWKDTGDCWKNFHCDAVGVETRWGNPTKYTAKCRCTIEDYIVTKCEQTYSIAAHGGVRECADLFGTTEARTVFFRVGWIRDLGTGDMGLVSDELAKRQLRVRSKALVEEKKAIMEKHWQSEVLAFLPAWRKAINYAADGMNTEVDKRTMIRIRAMSSRNQTLVV